MKNKLRKHIRKILIESFLKEYEENLERMIFDMPYEILTAIKNQKKIKFDLMPKLPYRRALQEFTKYGQFVRFPEKYILKWKDLLLENIAKLNGLTEIHGHSISFPYDEFHDIFDEPTYLGTSSQLNIFQDTPEEIYEEGEFTKWRKKRYSETGNEDYKKANDFHTIYEFLDTEYNIDDVTPQFSNDHHVLSDYATEPLLKLGVELEKQTSPEEIIVTINKILDVVHQRSDIAEIFIEGGSEALYDISYT